MLSHLSLNKWNGVQHFCYFCVSVWQHFAEPSCFSLKLNVDTFLFLVNVERLRGPRSFVQEIALNFLFELV